MIFIKFYSTIRNIKLKIVFKFSKCLSLISTISIYIYVIINFCMHFYVLQ